MKKFDLRTPIIYVLVSIIIVLLIIMKKMDDQNKQDTFSKRIDQLETKIDKVKEVQRYKEKNLKVDPPVFKGKIGVIIDDFGYRNDQVSDGFLKLDAMLTYAVIPGHEYSKTFSKKAKDSGFEVIVHMPMENTGKTYGEEEFVITTSMTMDVIERRIIKAFQQIPDAIGMNNHQGSKSSANQQTMTILAKILKKKNKFFIDSRTTVETVAETVMEVYGVPTARRNIFLDNDDDEEKILKQLRRLAIKSQEYGFAIGIGHAKPKTLNVLEREIPKLQKEGYKFEFVSKMLH